MLTSPKRPNVSDEICNTFTSRETSIMGLLPLRGDRGGNGGPLLGAGTLFDLVGRNLGDPNLE